MLNKLEKIVIADNAEGNNPYPTEMDSNFLNIFQEVFKNGINFTQIDVFIDNNIIPSPIQYDTIIVTWEDIKAFECLCKIFHKILTSRSIPNSVTFLSFYFSSLITNKVSRTIYPYCTATYQTYPLKPNTLYKFTTYISTIQYPTFDYIGDYRKIRDYPKTDILPYKLETIEE